MSDVLITVELPQRALTFSVNVPHLGTVQDIKQEIHRVCPGNPRIDGQRLISKGRILDDSESIEALWKVRNLFCLILAMYLTYPFLSLRKRREWFI